MLWSKTSTENQELFFENEFGIRMFIKREDTLHPFISGNKYRKLKYNLQAALTQKHHTLLTFGGAYSNHIAAVAYAAKISNLKSIGVIRGDELKDAVAVNPTLSFAKHYGMQLYFISRNEYKHKTSSEFQEHLKHQFGNFFLIPEGGTNTLAVKGCQEILTKTDADFDEICVAVGTGGTLAGLINSAKPHQKVLGFPALKHAKLSKDICKFVSADNWQLIEDYHFGGYAKVTEELIRFSNDFKQKNDILLDPIYTGKMMYGVYDMVAQGYFKPESKILCIHTGGLQGIEGMNQKLKTKGKTIIEI